MQQLAQKVRSIVSSAVGTLGSPAQFGIELEGAGGTADGTITFDASAFTNAVKIDPARVKDFMTGFTSTTTTTAADGTTSTTTKRTAGLVEQLKALADGATDSVSGTLVTLAK